MIDLSKRRYRTICVIEKYRQLYRYSSKEEQLLVSSSVLNFIWNAWSMFWRAYWNVYIAGGYDLTRARVGGVFPRYTIPQSCAYAKSLARGGSYTIGSTIQHYQEPTWGDPKLIINVASGLLPHIPSMNYLISFITSYKTELEELQKIRNAYIHINNESVNSLRSLEPLYIFRHDQKLLDILETKRIGSSKICFDSLVDNMVGCLENLS